MKKVCGFALIFFSIGMIFASLINGFLVSSLLIIGSMTAGILLFISRC
ncbi:MAG: hypothetical protein IJ137_12055 [Eubacterium sp.]|nr:hypothetical protein [Eubacterium sp.]